MRIIEEPGRVMAQKQLRRFPQEHHPFSLLTLIQSPKPPGLLKREDGVKGEQVNSEGKESSNSNSREEEEEVRLMNRQQQLVRREPESAAGFLLGEQQQQQSSFSSRAAHCQTVAADLSLHSSTSSYPPPSSASYPTTSVSSSFPPSSEPPPLFYPLLPARTPLTHNLAGYDFFQHQQQGGPAEFSSEGLPPPAPQPFTDYQEYYDRLLLLLYYSILSHHAHVNIYLYLTYVCTYT